MGFDNDCILDVQSLAGEYFCAVCRTLVYPDEAFQGPCTHLYCKPCLAYVVSTTHACPYDGYRVTEADTKPLLEANKTLADTIGKIQVHCLFYKTGCTWQGSLSDCTSHCSTCGFGESAVICNKCGVQLKHRQMPEHAQKCYGVHYQVQQQGGVQDSNSIGPCADPGQTKTDFQTGGPVSSSIVSNHDASQTANSATQPKVPQATMPTEQGVHYQVQQLGGIQDSSSIGPTATLGQTKIAFQIGGPLSQLMSQVSSSIVSSNDASQTANSATQPKVAQAAMLTEQMYHQHLQNQQYFGFFDPYLQIYRYYYPHPQTQQYQQPQAQAYPQVFGQPQPLSSSQTPAQIQPVIQAQQQVVQQQQPQAQAYPQVYGQPQPLSSSQSPAQIQPVVQAQQQVVQQQQPQAQAYTQVYGQPQPLSSSQTLAQTQHIQQAQQQVQLFAPNQGAQAPLQSLGQASMSHALSSNPARPPSAAQQYIRPQPLPQQQLLVPQYPQTHPWMQHPPLPPYPHPQTQVQSQPHSETNIQAPVNYSQQPIPPSTHLQTSHAVTGYQPQPQLQSLPQSHCSDRPDQQQPAMLPGQGPPPRGPSAQQLPTYAQAQQPGHLYQQRPSAQATQQAFPGHSPFKQRQTSMTAEVHSQVPSQMPPQSQQNYGQPRGAHSDAGRPLGVQAVVHPYGQPTGHAGTDHFRPQLNQNYPRLTNRKLSSINQLDTPSQHVSSSEKSRDPEKSGQVRDQTTNNQLSSVEQLATQSLHVSSSEKPCDQMLEKGIHEQINTSEVDRDMAMASSKRSNGDEVKLKAKNDSGAIPDEHLSQTCLSGSKQLLDAATKVDNIVQEANPTAKRETVECVSKTSGDVDKIVSKNEFKTTNGQDLKHTAKHGADNSALCKTLKSGSSSMDQSRNQLPPLPYVARKSDSSSMPQSRGPHVNSQQPAFIGHTSYQLRPRGFGQAPSYAPSLENPSIAGSVCKTGYVNCVQGNVPSHNASRPQNPLGDHLVRPTVTTHTRRPGTSGHEIDKFGAQRSGRIYDRQPASPPYRPIEQNSFGHGAYGIQQGAVKIGGSSARGAMPVPGMLDEGAMPFFEQHSKHLPHKEFEDEFQKSLRPPQSIAEPSNFGQLDHGSLMFGGDTASRSFQTEPHGFDHDPGFGRALMDGLPPKNPAKDYPSLPSRTFQPYEGVGRNESWSFESSKPYNYSAEPSRKPTHESRFPVHPRGNLDVWDNLHLGEHFAQNHDFMPSHLQRGGHLGEATAFACPRGPSRIEPPLGSFPSHIPFSDSLGGEKPGHCLQGESGFKNGQGVQRFADDNAFNAREVDHSRKRKPGSMCQIFNVECGTVEDLESHSQSSEHQRMARDIVVKINEQNKKMQKVSRDRASVKEGRDGGKPGSMCQICNVECGTVEDLELHSQSSEHQRMDRDTVVKIKEQNEKMQKVSSDRASVKEGRDGGKPKNSGFKGN